VSARGSRCCDPLLVSALACVVAPLVARAATGAGPDGCSGVPAGRRLAASPLVSVGFRLPVGVHALAVDPTRLHSDQPYNSPRSTRRRGAAWARQGSSCILTQPAKLSAADVSQARSPASDEVGDTRVLESRMRGPSSPGRRVYRPEEADRRHSASVDGGAKADRGAPRELSTCAASVAGTASGATQHRSLTPTGAGSPGFLRIRHRAEPVSRAAGRRDRATRQRRIYVGDLPPKSAGVGVGPRRTRRPEGETVPPPRLSRAYHSRATQESDSREGSSAPRVRRRAFRARISSSRMDV